MKLSDTLILGLAVVARAAIPTAATTSNSEEICSKAVLLSHAASATALTPLQPAQSVGVLSSPLASKKCLLEQLISLQEVPAPSVVTWIRFSCVLLLGILPWKREYRLLRANISFCSLFRVSFPHLAFASVIVESSLAPYILLTAENRCAAPPCNGVYDPVARGCSNNAYIYPTISTGGIAKQLKNGYGRAEEAYTPSPAVPTYDSQATDIASAIGAIPSCATSCMFSSIAADGCEIADFKCHCSSGAKIRPQLAPCIAKACSSSDEDAFYAQVESFCQEVYSNSGDVSSSVITSTSIPSATTVLPTKPASTETTSSGYITVSEILISVDSTPTPVGGNITTLIANTTTIAADTGSLSGDITSTAISNASAKTTKSSVSRSTSTEKSSTTNTSKALAAIATAKSYLTHGVVAAIGGVLLVI
ncbi:MAG: hypothetical protein M1813_008649 [Trichoglossum hirsutum]|nr:MAG: hypothetical protein M1813_008649 [Trichoglossum hirsutum]